MTTLDNTEKTLQAQNGLKLTHRESEILELLAQGSAQKEIAAHLEISKFTVDVHIKHIKTKTGLQKATELTVLYYTGRYHLPLNDLPATLRPTISTALPMLSLFDAKPAGAVKAHTATDFNYQLKTA
jgi:DNA-binding CsgD family transcriptional regulator